MEDVMLRMPAADVALIMQFATRMGWLVNPPVESTPYTWSQARERIAVAKEQFKNGEYKLHEEVMQPRKVG